MVPTTESLFTPPTPGLSKCWSGLGFLSGISTHPLGASASCSHCRNAQQKPTSFPPWQTAPICQEFESSKPGFTPPLYAQVPLKSHRNPVMSARQECYSHFTGEGTRPQRRYLRSNGRKWQSELNSVFILSFSSKTHTITKTQAVSLPLFPILCVLPLAVSCRYTVSHCLGYHGGVLLHLTESISWSSKKHWIPTTT